MSAVIDISGLRFGRWTVVRFAGARHGKRQYVCRCDCGRERPVAAGHLRRGLSTSCGCRAKEANQARATHGRSGTLEYMIWGAMVQRCCNPRARAYPKYGGRGITICDRWRRSFEAFIADMGPRPSPSHSVERKDNNGPYSPANCVWATDETQANNSRQNVFLEFGGRRLTVTQWSREIGCDMHTLRSRLRMGWSVDKALTTPIKPATGRHRKRAA